MPTFAVNGVPRGGGEPKPLMIDAPTADDARMKAASRGLKVMGVKPMQDPAKEGLVGAPVTPRDSQVSDAPTSAATIPTAPFTPVRPHVPPEHADAVRLAARYLAWLGVVLLVYGGYVAYLGVGALDRNAYWIDRILRICTVWAIFLLPSMVCFMLAVKVLSEAAWSFMAGTVVAGLAAVVLALFSVLCLFGLPATLVPLLIAFIPLVFAIATVVQTAKAMRTIAANQPPRGFQVGVKGQSAR